MKRQSEVEEYTEKKYTSVTKWLWIQLFIGIPVVNLVLLGYYGFRKRDSDLKNYSRSLLLIKLVTFVISIVICFLIGSFINAHIGELRELVSKYIG